MNTNYLKEYEKWLADPVLANEDRGELESIKDNDKEIRERFSGLLSFGTAGLRGKMRMGPNGMNVYTVRLATQAMACVIKEETKDICEEPGCKGNPSTVTIAYDSRNNSGLFAEEAARVLAANGIGVNLFESLRPTPELSFALRKTGSIAGINITASHNTKEYNGFKAYWEDGAQIGADYASRIASYMESLDIFRDVKLMGFDDAKAKGHVTIIGNDIDEEYIDRVIEQSAGEDYVRRAGDDVKIVFTPFHGTGYSLVPQVLEKVGIRNIVTVPEQMELDGDFPTVASPNPEYRESFKMAIDLAEKEGADLIIGTDPDGDRCGLVIRCDEGYRALTGNQIGVLLLDHIIRSRKEEGRLRERDTVIKSIVTTTMADAICQANGIDIVNVLTGFKYIGEKIKEYEESGERTFLFGFEESNGYLAGTYARDKDAILASMLISQMASYHRLEGRTLADALDELYDKYGQYRERVDSYVFEGLDGKAKMAEIMDRLRKDPPRSIGLDVKGIRDYSEGSIRSCDGTIIENTELPPADILYYELDEGCTAIIRPSGTEPKIKIYIMARGESAEEAEERLEQIASATGLLLE